MSKRSLGSIILDVEARTQRLETQMKRANSITRKHSRAMRQSFNGVSAAAKRIAVALGLIAVPAAIVALTKRSLEAGNALAKTSDKLGIATEKLAGLQHAAELNGVSVDTFNMALQRMVRRVAEAGQGTGEAVKALKELGLNARELAALSPDKQFEKVADAMQNVATQGDRVRLAMKLFDSEGVSLVNVLRMGSEGLAKMQEEAEKLGIALNRVDSAKFEIASDAVLRLKEVFSGLGNLIATQMAPVIAGVADAITEWGTSGEGMAVKVTAALEKVSGYLGVALDTFSKGRAVIKALQIAVLAVPLVLGSVAEKILSINQALWEKLIELANKARAMFNEVPRMMRLGIPDLEMLEVPKMKGLEAIKDFTQGLSEEMDGLAEQAAEIWGDNPSERMEAFFDKAKAKYQAMAEDIAAAAAGGQAKSTGGGTATFDWGAAVFEDVDAKLAPMQDKAQQFSDTLREGFERAALAGGDFGNTLKDLGQDLLQMILKTQILAPLMNGIFGGGASAGGGLGGIIGSFIGGARALGGPVAAGVPYMVGESGPELFVPSANGRIDPNGSGGDAITINMPLNISTGVQDTVRAEFVSLLPTIEGVAVGAVRKARAERRLRS